MGKWNWWSPSFLSTKKKMKEPELIESE